MNRTKLDGAFLDALLTEPAFLAPYHQPAERTSVSAPRIVSSEIGKDGVLRTVVEYPPLDPGPIDVVTTTVRVRAPVLIRVCACGHDEGRYAPALVCMSCGSPAELPCGDCRQTLCECDELAELFERVDAELIAQEYDLGGEG